MPLQKQALNINFESGVDTKTDPFQIPPGKFLALENTVFNTDNLLQKRNGYKSLASLPSTNFSYATTFNGNLTAIGPTLAAYSAGSMTWVEKASVHPLQLDTLPVVRSNTNQVQQDIAVASNGLVCTVFTDLVPVSGSNVAKYKYVVSDHVTGQNIAGPTEIAVTSGAVAGSPRVFVLGNYFIIVFTNLISATNHLQYKAINMNTPTVIGTEVDISATYTPATTVNFDGVVANNTLFLAWNGSDIGGAIRMTSINSSLTQSGTVVFATRVATIMSVTADITGSTAVIYASFYNSGTSTGYVLAVNQSLVTILAPTQIIASGTFLNIAAAAQNGVCTVFYEASNNYSYDSGVPSHFVNKKTVTQAGVVSSVAVVARSVGLASKAFIYNSVIYFLGIYYSVYQPTYFLINSSGVIAAKLAYQNAGTYLVLGLPSVTVETSIATIGYLFKDLVQAVNKTQGLANPAGVYAQTGINLVNFDLDPSSVVTSEIGSNLNLSGGFLWAYDGTQAVEQGFFLYPDNVEVTGSTTGGTMTAQQYFYSVTYEWADNQGNLFRSAPSIPVSVTTTGATSSVTVNIPTLRLTYKTLNPVKLVVYRWSTGQQTYYQATSILTPTLNSVTVDSVAYVDTLPDSSIIGNNILYTTGGVIENIGAPATTTMTLFKSRLFILDSEDRNLLWYSKEVIEGTPVEMSDLFTIFVAPTTGSQGSTGPITALSSMDDKLIIFKKDAIYYITGTGPDSTGANNDFSEPVFITSTVGCDNQESIVFCPEGLMFQSDKGIWLLGRNLSTVYIGAEVQAYNGDVVLSAVNVPATNQVRFTLDSGKTLMYDYFEKQWGTFTGVAAISSTLYESLHTYINQYGEVLQENPGSYLDGSRPVDIFLTTSWFNLAGLQGLERAYFFYLIGTYYSPHTLTVSIAYDYNPSASQQVIITPDNFSPVYGDDTIYGGGNPYGGPSSLEQWRIFFEKQKIQSFQISIKEQYDSSMGAPAGAGLTLSGLDIIVGLKKAYTTISAANSIG